MLPYGLAEYTPCDVFSLPAWLALEVEKYCEARPELADPEIARGKCSAASAAFINVLIDRGFLTIEQRCESWAVDEVAVVDDIVHYAAQIDDWIIDFTARQFHPAAPWPLLWKLTAVSV